MMSPNPTTTTMKHMPILTPRNSPLGFRSNNYTSSTAAAADPASSHILDDEKLVETTALRPETNVGGEVSTSYLPMHYKEWTPPVILRKTAQSSDIPPLYPTSSSATNTLLPVARSPSLPPSIIKASSSPNIPIGNRFTASQRDRTIRHHKLIQPTSSQEKVHLASLRAERQIEMIRSSSSSCLSLLTLPEEEDEDSMDRQEEVDLEELIFPCENDVVPSVFHETQDVRALSPTNHVVCMERVFKHSLSLSTTRSSISAMSMTSDQSTTSLSLEGDVNSEVSPTTTLFVPGEEQLTVRKLSSDDELSINFKLTHTDDSSTPKLDTIDCTSTTSMQYSFCRPCEMMPHSSMHRFVVCADTQFGITKVRCRTRALCCEYSMTFDRSALFANASLLFYPPTHFQNNQCWNAEMDYSNNAVDQINEMDPRPAFVCVCGDLVDMEFSFEKKKGSKSKFPSTLFNGATGIASREVCDSIQDEQNEDFKRIWSRLHPDIAVVCLCGNHGK